MQLLWLSIRYIKLFFLKYISAGWRWPQNLSTLVLEPFEIKAFAFIGAVLLYGYILINLSTVKECIELVIILEKFEGVNYRWRQFVGSDKKRGGKTDEYIGFS